LSAPANGLDAWAATAEQVRIGSASNRFRIGWTYRPGADIFLVFNQTWDAAPTLGLRRERDRQAILKMTYLIAV
jgi:hypothetical protein